MGLEYSVTLRNEKEMAAWEQSLQAQRKNEQQLQRNVQAFKGNEAAAKALQTQQKAIADTEAQIERERAANANADISRLQQKLAIHRQVAAEIQKTAASDFQRPVRRRGHDPFQAGLRRWEDQSDPMQAGIRQLEAQRRAEESAKAMQNAFITGGPGGMAYKPPHDPWAEGMAKITGQNQAAAKKAAEETAAAQRRLVEEVNRLKVTPLEHYAERMVKLKSLLRSGEIDQRGFNAAAKDAAEKLAAAGKAGDESFGDRARAALQSYIAGFFSFTAVLGLARAGWQSIIEAQDRYLEKSREILEFNQSLASAQANAVLNFTGLSEERTKSVIEKEVPAMQERTGFGDQRLLLNAVSSGYAASDNDIEVALKAAESAAKINRNTQEQIGVQTGAAIDIMRHTGIKDPDVALSFLLQMNPRGTDPVKIAQSAPPVLGMARNASQTDDDLEAARAGAAMFTVLGRQGTDYSGEQSGTATNKFLELQREYFTKERAGYARKMGYDVSTIPGRMAALEKDEKLRKDFLGGMSKKGAVEYRPAIENLITPGRDANKAFHSEFERLQFTRESYEEIQRKMGSIGQLPLGNMAAQAEANKQFTASDIENQKRSIRQQMLKDTDEVIQRSLTAGIDDSSWYGSDSSLMGVGPPTGLKLGRRLAKTLSIPEEVTSQREAREMLLRRRSHLRDAQATGDQEGVSKYRSDIATLERHLKLLEQQTKQLEEMNRRLEDIGNSNQKMADEPPMKLSPPNPNGGGRD